MTEFKRLARAAIRRTLGLLWRYRAPAGPKDRLSRATVEQVPMAADGDNANRPTGNLYRIWKTIPGGNKWWHYFSVYERLVGPVRSVPIRFLEIGVYKGGSLAMWRQYLHAETVIVGLDIDRACLAFDRPDEGVHVRIGDQSDHRFLRAIVEEFGPFDVIIDDGSHVCSHMIKTFDFLFLNGLAENGLYIAEDTHSNFWPGYRDQGYSFVDLCKDLVDLSHAHYAAASGVREFTLGSPDRLDQVSVTRIGAQIEEIRFFDSIVALRRAARRNLPTSEHL